MADQPSMLSDSIRCILIGRRTRILTYRQEVSVERGEANSESVDMEPTRPKYTYDNVSGNYYNKYESKNPVVRVLMRGFLSVFDELVGLTDARDVLEVGCGEGHLSLRMLRAGLRVTAIDREMDAVKRAQEFATARGFQGNFGVKDLYELEEQESRELVVCCEVLEHLPAPGPALERLVTLARPWLLLSVPREPLWRCLNVVRGKYLADFGNTPGHIQHWGKGEFLRLVSNYATIEAIRNPLPWTMVLCRRH
jgi:2-polyprenyl-3-methyl-5-hydroxy-6-metoxy-1,4-benzoquinol methylase